MNDDLRGTAYHEAGHAVIGVLLGLKVFRATVVPTEDTRGHVEAEGWQAVADEWDLVDDTDSDTLKWMEAMAIKSLAGWHAENSATGTADPELAHEDRHGPLGYWDMLDRLVSGPDKLQECSDKLEKRCEQLVQEQWPAIEAVATALLERQTLTGAEIQEIIAGVEDKPDR